MAEAPPPRAYVVEWTLRTPQWSCALGTTIQSGYLELPAVLTRASGAGSSLKFHSLRPHSSGSRLDQPPSWAPSPGGAFAQAAPGRQVLTLLDLILQKYKYLHRGHCTWGTWTVRARSSSSGVSICTFWHAAPQVSIFVLLH